MTTHYFVNKKRKLLGIYGFSQPLSGTTIHVKCNSEVGNDDVQANTVFFFFKKNKTYF
jgi:hypothetical protein